MLGCLNWGHSFVLEFRISLSIAWFLSCSHQTSKLNPKAPTFPFLTLFFLLFVIKLMEKCVYLDQLSQCVSFIKHQHVCNLDAFWLSEQSREGHTVIFVSSFLRSLIWLQNYRKCNVGILFPSEILPEGSTMPMSESGRALTPSQSSESFCRGTENFWICEPGHYLLLLCTQRQSLVLTVPSA